MVQSEEASTKDNMVQLRKFQLQPHSNVIHQAINDGSKSVETGIDSKDKPYAQQDSP